ncbi:lysozyme [Vibrio salinus]|uniref:lysozyme n=1 Tax=Vibrio salinus TaxID=2899784 RepID=UPI001E5DFFB5|nr:lysozyme [Vibrio salinus]MCE0495761.1 lysozyme [Vibrio salinus]
MSRVKTVTCSVMAIIAVVIGSHSVTDKNKPVGDVVISGEKIGTLFISEQALELIGNAESCRRSPYKCPAGLDTDGIGNTHNVTRESKTDEQIAIDWVRNNIRAQDCLKSSVDISLLTQGQKDAFVSFIFNTGCTRFKKNGNGTYTRIYKKLVAHKFTAACGELKYWVYGAGKKLPGLVTRRSKETALCLQ